MKADDVATKLENQPVVGLHKVNPLWHLHLARPDKVAHGELVKSGLKDLCSIEPLWPTIKKRNAEDQQTERINLLLEEGCKGHGELLLADILN